MALAFFGFTRAVDAQGPGLGPAPVYTTVVNGNFVATGTSISEERNSVREPGDAFTLTIDIPGTGTVVKAFANWSYLTATPDDVELRTISIDGQQVQVDLGGVVQSLADDICHLTSSDGRTAVYLADVTGIIAGGIDANGHGLFLVEGAVEDDDPAKTVGPLGEGISLLVVYSDPAEPLRLINVYSGLIQTGGSVWEAEATLEFFDDSLVPKPVQYLGGPFNLFLNALDGQAFDGVGNVSDDHFLFLRGEQPYQGGWLNDNPCSIGQGPVWCGKLGPGPVDTNWYDHGSGDLEAYNPAIMEEGDTSVTFKTEAVNDCIGISFAGVAFQFTPCERIYVDADATGANDGSSWADAYNHLQDALANVQIECSTGSIDVWVAEGIYRPDEDTLNPIGTGDRSATFQLLSDVGIYGGFAGVETSLDQRNLRANVAVLSGDLLGNDDPGFVNNDENSYHVIIASSVDETAILDGFTISGGNANGVYTSGAGMRIASGSPAVRNCSFIANSAGDASGGSGGAVFKTGLVSAPRFVNCLFAGNAAISKGGGMSINDGALSLTNCTFSGNVALDPGPFGGGDAGGVFVSYGDNTQMTNCIFWGNEDSGGMDQSAQVFVWTGTPAVNYSCIQGLVAGGMFDSGSNTNNIDADPLFVDPANGDYRLLCGSPADDAGDNDAVPPDTSDLDGDGDTAELIPYDLDGRARFADDWCAPDSGNPGGVGPPIVDMGAYEHQVIAPGPEPGGPSCSTDADCTNAGDRWFGAACVAGTCYVPKNRYLTIGPTTNADPVVYSVMVVEASKKVCNVTLSQQCEVDGDCPQGETCEYKYNQDVLWTDWWLDDPVCKDLKGVTCNSGDAPAGGHPECLTDYPDVPISNCSASDPNNNDQELMFGWYSSLGPKNGPAPPARLWTESPLHIGDCIIAPVITYMIGARHDCGCFWAPLEIMTIRQPDEKDWGDITGGAIAGPYPQDWSPPNRITNMTDIQGVIAVFEQLSSGYMPVCWADLAMDQKANMTDVQWSILAFEGNLYTQMGGACGDCGELPTCGNGIVECNEQCDDGDTIPGDWCSATCLCECGGGNPLPECTDICQGQSGSSSEGGSLLDGASGATSPTFSLVPAAELINAGDLVDVDVFIDYVADLGAYQVGLEVTGGDAGSLDLEDLTIDTTRQDYVFGSDPIIPAIDMNGGRLGAVRQNGGIEVTGPAYLATFSYRASADASGVFTVSVRGGGESFLNNSYGGEVASSAGDPASIGVDIECFLVEHCDDGNDCTADACVSYACQNDPEPSGTPCDDGLFCTAIDECDGSGTCVGRGNPCPRPQICNELMDVCIGGPGQ